MSTDSRSRRERELEKALKGLIHTSRKVVAMLDREMTAKESHERGKRVAAIVGSLEYALDAADHFTLNRTFLSIKNSKRKIVNQGFGVKKGQ